MTAASQGSAEEPFNPLDKGHLGESVAWALLERPFSPLPPPERFFGAGIYAIYYNGSFAPYEPVTARDSSGNPTTPIYVGEAVPAGARKGGFGLGLAPGRAIYNRLQQHAKTLQDANNLELQDFSCRFLVVDDIWIPLGETLLIERFSPLWNVILDGFGNHNPGSGRYRQEKSAWDVVHPGRAWAERCAPHHRSLQELLTDIAVFFSIDR